MRDALGLKKGDLVEVELDSDRVVMTPKRLMQEHAFQRLVALLDHVHEQNKGVSEDEVTRDVLTAITEFRAEQDAPAKKIGRRAR